MSYPLYRNRYLWTSGLSLGQRVGAGRGRLAHRARQPGQGERRESATDVRLDGDEMPADADDGDAGHFSRTYLRVTSRLLASGLCDGQASCPGSDSVPARTSTPSAPSAGRRGPTGTAGSSPGERVSTSAKTVSICAPRFWKRSGPSREGAWARDAGDATGTYMKVPGTSGSAGGREATSERFELVGRPSPSRDDGVPSRTATCREGSAVLLGRVVALRLPAGTPAPDPHVDRRCRWIPDSFGSA